MKKSKLLIEYDFDFQLLGVSASVKGYKLAWAINQAPLQVHLVKQTDLIVGFKNNIEKSFAHYSYETAINRLKLFKNRSSDADAGKYFLIPEFPHFDFIILAAMEEQILQRLVATVKSIPDVQLIASIPLEGLKSKTNFIF